MTVTYNEIMAMVNERMLPYAESKDASGMHRVTVTFKDHKLVYTFRGELLAATTRLHDSM